MAGRLLANADCERCRADRSFYLREARADFEVYGARRLLQHYTSSEHAVSGYSITFGSIVPHPKEESMISYCVGIGSILVDHLDL